MELNKILNSIDNMADIINETEDVDGWLTKREGMSLYYCSRFGAGAGEIVEIGSFKGKSTIWLAKGSKHAGRERINAIDPHTGSPEHQESKSFPEEGTTSLIFQENIKKHQVEDFVNQIVKTSEEASKNWDKPIRLLFIDGAHEYDMVEKDFLLWEPHLAEGGIIAFHDVGIWDGPTKVIDKYIKNSDKFDNIVQVGSIVFAVKK